MWSALRQTLTDYEIIVVDDASTDGTAEWIQQTYPQITLIQLKQNSGGAVARNTGITVARGALIACLDSDDEWSPTFLEQQVKAIDHVSNCSLAYANYIAVVEGQDNVSTISREQRHKDPILAMLLWPFIDSLSLTLIPAHVFERVGLFNEQLRIAYDLELYLRLLKHGKLIHTQQYLVKKHWVHDSLSTQVLGKYRFINELKVINYFFQDPENHPYREYRKQAEKFLKRRSRK
jgi:glycosyltransferase involved in cell wall biosynthesis